MQTVVDGRTISSAISCLSGAFSQRISTERSPTWSGVSLARCSSPADGQSALGQAVVGAAMTEAGLRKVLWVHRARFGAVTSTREVVRLVLQVDNPITATARASPSSCLIVSVQQMDPPHGSSGATGHCPLPA